MWNNVRKNESGDEKIDTNLSCISHNHYDHSYTDALNIIPRDDFNKSNVD